MLAVLTGILSCLETRDQIRRLGPDKVNPLLEGAKVFVSVVLVGLVGSLGVAVLAGWVWSEFR